ncbi:MAG: NAD/NADP octopine/nopaline dehydrogenase family protein [Candidatus Obscuribacterales bacterium]|nr:NAD/NADP octopine/nopaline dehydrogenase family protein [Candidatus Obscuribacterales bacterium]
MLSFSQVAEATLIAPVLETRSIAVIGAGNSARALSAYLSQLGHDVSLLTRTVAKIPNIFERRTVVATGKVNGEFKLANVGTDVDSIISDNEIIFVATVAGAYPDVARTIAPYLNSKHKVILFSGKLGGVLEFSKILSECGAPEIPVLETDALFACRSQDDESIWIRGHKQWTLYSAQDRSTTLEFRDLIESFFPGLGAAKNVVERGLTDFGAAAHAPIVIANMNKIDRAEPFLFYYEGLTERTVAILENIEEEFRAVAEAYGGTLIPMKDLLFRYYGCEDRSTLLTAMQTVPNYKHSQAPATLEHRFLIEDVSCTLVPAQQFARLAGVETPVIDAVVTFACILSGVDCRKVGRSLSKYGLANLNYDQVHTRLNK